MSSFTARPSVLLGEWDIVILEETKHTCGLQCHGRPYEVRVSMLFSVKTCSGLNFCVLGQPRLDNSGSAWVHLGAVGTIDLKDLYSALVCSFGYCILHYAVHLSNIELNVDICRY